MVGDRVARGKRVKKRAIPHALDLFDSPDKLWQRFQDLAFPLFSNSRWPAFKEETKSLVAIPG